MMEGLSEIMTFEETAKYLKIGKSTLCKMAKEGKIPAVKIDIIQISLHSKATEVCTHFSTKNL